MYVPKTIIKIQIEVIDLNYLKINKLASGYILLDQVLMIELQYILQANIFLKNRLCKRTKW